MREPDVQLPVTICLQGGEPEVPGRESFPQRERLTRSSEFRDVYARGKRQSGRAFICYVVRQERQGRKLGLTVSRKVGGAVTRNRVKRYIREVYRTSREHLDDDFYMVIVARPAAAQMSFAECEGAIRQLFRKGDVLSD